jgi:hypothetical protein
MTGACDTRQVVWYAAYGSNMCAARFGCYIQGGRPAGSKRVCKGARDKRPPSISIAIEIPYRLYFAGASKAWGGSPAFVDTQCTDSDRSLARAYLIHRGQFEDVVAQENGRETAPIDVDRLSEFGTEQIGPGRYETLLCVGARGGVPIVTFTSPRTLSTVTPGQPSLSYLAMLIAGLREAHELDDGSIVDYLAAAPGCESELVHRALARFG